MCFARIGGDEFGVILAHVTADQATKKGESLAKALDDHPPDDRRQARALVVLLRHL